MGQRERRWQFVAVADEPHTVAETSGLYGRQAPADRSHGPWASPARMKAASPISFAACIRCAASMTKVWPFQLVSRAACRTIGRPCLTPMQLEAHRGGPARPRWRQSVRGRCRDRPPACVPADVMPRGDEPSRIARIGDDSVAPRRDTAIEHLERRTAAVAAVVGRDERTPSNVRRGTRSRPVRGFAHGPA